MQKKKERDREIEENKPQNNCKLIQHCLIKVDSMILKISSVFLLIIIILLLRVAATRC